MLPYVVCGETCWAGEGPKSHRPLDVNRKTKGSLNLTPFPTKTFPARTQGGFRRAGPGASCSALRLQCQEQWLHAVGAH